MKQLGWAAAFLLLYVVYEGVFLASSGLTVDAGWVLERVLTVVVPALVGAWAGKLLQGDRPTQPGFVTYCLGAALGCGGLFLFGTRVWEAISRGDVPVSLTPHLVDRWSTNPEGFAMGLGGELIGALISVVFLITSFRGMMRARRGGQAALSLDERPEFRS